MTINEYIAFMETIWKNIPGWPGYMASIYGDVKSMSRVIIRRNGAKWTAREQLLRPSITQGYKYVGLYNAGRSKRIFVHKLVAITFLENNGLLPEVNHKDYDKLNNQLSNLEWVSTRENTSHAKKMYKKTSKYTGVSFAKRYGRWAAFIRDPVLKKNKNLGLFNSEETASLAYQKALLQFGVTNKYL